MEAGNLPRKTLACEISKSWSRLSTRILPLVGEGAKRRDSQLTNYLLLILTFVAAGFYAGNGSQVGPSLRYRQSVKLRRARVWVVVRNIARRIRRHHDRRREGVRGRRELRLLGQPPVGVRRQTSAVRAKQKMSRIDLMRETRPLARDRNRLVLVERIWGQHLTRTL
jgi:hypothetical protein